MWRKYDVYMKRLSECECGMPLKICGMCGKIDKMLQRLLDLGFVVDEKIVIISKSFHGQTFLVEIRGAKFSVRKEQLSHILVN